MLRAFLHVEHTKLAFAMDPDFHHAGTHVCHRSEIRWCFAALHQVELVACARANLRWGLSQPPKAVAQPRDRFPAQPQLYTIVYIPDFIPHMSKPVGDLEAARTVGEAVQGFREEEQRVFRWAAKKLGLKLAFGPRTATGARLFWNLPLY